MSRPLLSTLLLREGTGGPQGSALVADPLEVLAELGVHAATELPIGRSSSPDSQPEDRPAPDVGPEGDTARRGRYRLIRELGRGGMGRVALAEDLELKRLVAVKEIDVDQKENGALLARFVAEARITAQLDHPAIVPVHEVGLTRTGTLFYAMKCVTGQSLRDVLRTKEPEPGANTPWSTTRLLGALVQVGRALHHAHERGALHLDVKPENIMLGGGGEVFLMDWGLAERFTDAGLDPYCVLGGTPGYMPPELFEHDRARIGPWTDAFAYGAVLYETLVRSPAIPGDTLAEVRSRTLDEDVPDPRLRHPRGVCPTRWRRSAPGPSSATPGNAPGRCWRWSKRSSGGSTEAGVQPKQGSASGRRGSASMSGSACLSV